MKIDWKHLCTTPGYMSLKKAAVLRVIMEDQKQQSKRKGKKARWTKEQKEQAKRIKAYEKQEAIKKAST